MTRQGRQAIRQGPLLLLVEDEPIILEIMQIVLEDDGYVVLTATNGNEAMAILVERASELAGLVTDIRLPCGPDGWEIARSARGIASLPVIYMTGDSAEHWREHGVPGSELLQKPFSPARLSDTLAKLTNSRR